MKWKNEKKEMLVPDGRLEFIPVQRRVRLANGVNQSDCQCRRASSPCRSFAESRRVPCGVEKLGTALPRS